MLLVGREREQRTVDELLQSAREERSAKLVLRGEPGIGKSALLEYAEQNATGMRVLRCTGIESEHEMPFAGMHQLLRPCLDLIERLPPPQVAALKGALGLSFERVQDRFLVSLGALNLLAEACETEPILCIVDDAQWLDSPSQDALSFAARRLQAEPIAVLVAAREGDPRRFESPGLPELELGGLARDDARTLLEARLARQASPDVVEALVAAAAGNPLALLELPAGLTETQLGGSEPIVGPPPARGAVEKTFRERVARLPERARLALLVAAADDSGDTGVLARAATHVGASLGDLDDAETAGLVTVDGRVEFRHPLVRSAAYQSASRDERRAAHEALAGAIEDPVRSVWHRAVIVDRADEGLAAELEAGGNAAAARGAHGTAALAFERAAELSRDQSRRGGRLRLAAQAALDAGRSDTAVALAERARTLVTDPFDHAQLHMIRATEQARRGSIREGHELMKSAAGAVSGVDPDTSFELMLWALFSGLQGGWADRVVLGIHDSLHEIDSDTQLARFGRALLSGLVKLQDGDYATAGDRLAEALSLSELFEGRSKALTPFVALFQGDLPNSRRLGAAALALNRLEGSLVHMVGMLGLQSACEVSARRPAAAEACTSEGIELGRQLGYVHDVTGMVGCQARVEALRGNEEQCRALAEEAIGLAIADGVGWAALMGRLALAEIELGLGDPREAIEHYEQLDPSLLPPIAMVATPDLIDACVRAGELAKAQAAFERFEEWSRVSPAAYMSAMVERCRAMLTDDDAEADRCFERALELHAHEPPPYERARTQLAYGEHLRRGRRKIEARIHLRAAQQTFEGLGIPLWAERARGELNATGETARKRDVSTVDQLTPQELRVAQLVAAGATNRDAATQLFVSPKTVEYHLRKVFVKLGVGSRVELARVPLGQAD